MLIRIFLIVMFGNCHPYSDVLLHGARKHFNVSTILLRKFALNNKYISRNSRFFPWARDLQFSEEIRGNRICAKYKEACASSCRSFSRRHCRNSDVNWPPRSCDLMSLKYFLRATWKVRCTYTSNPEAIRKLKDEIRRVILEIESQLCGKCYRKCRKKSGSLWKVLRWSFSRYCLSHTILIDQSLWRNKETRNFLNYSALY